MKPDPTLTALVHAYIAGDRVARLALVDWLEEQGDPRSEEVRAACIDWNAVARIIYGRLYNVQGGPAAHGGWYHQTEVNRCRWLIDCALAGADVPPEVREAVQDAHRDWLAGLFPEVS